MADSAQIKIDTASALRHVDELVNKMQHLVDVSKDFGDALDNRISKPLVDSKRALSGFAKSVEHFSSAFTNLGSIIHTAFDALVVPESGFSAIQKLTQIIQTLTEIGNIDKGSSFAKLGQSFASLGKGLSALNSFSRIDSGGLAIAVDNLYAFYNHMTKLAQSPSFAYFERVANAMYKVSTASKNLATATDKVQRSFNKLNPTVKQTKSLFQRLHPSVRQLFTAFVGYNVIYAFVRAIQSAVREMVDFEDKMARVNTIAKGTKSQLASWTQGVMNLSSTYGLAKNDLTQALYDINSATITGSRAFLVLEAASKAAVAGFTDVSKTAELLSRIINAYGYSASDAGRLSDILFKTVERGINPMEELSQYMGRVLTVAANAGVAFEEVSAAIATMTSRGIQTNIAVTSLNSAILKLSQGSDRLNVVFQQYGYVSSAAALQTGGLAEAVRILHQATGGATEALTKLGFNYRDIRAMAVLASDSFSEFKKNLEAMENADGATDAALKERAETLQMKWNRLKETIGNAFIALQQWAGASEFFKGLVDALSDLVNFMVRVVTASEDSLTFLESLTRTVLKLIVLFKMIKFNIAIFTTLRTNIGLLTNAWRFWNTQIKAQGGLLKTLRNTLTVLKIAHTEYARTGKFSMNAVRNAAIAQGVSLKALRASVILLKNAWMPIVGIALAALEIAAFEAIEQAMTKGAEDVEAVRLEFEGATKAVNDFATALAQLRLSDISDSEAPQAAKVMLDELRSQINALQAQVDTAKKSGQPVSPTAMEKLDRLWRVYIYYRDQYNEIIKKREQDTAAQKEWINVSNIALKVHESYINFITKETSVLSKYLAALQQASDLKAKLAGLGIDVSLVGIDFKAFKDQIEQMHKDGKIDEDTRVSLINYANALDSIAKNAKQASSEMKSLEKSLFAAAGLNTPFHEALRAAKHYDALLDKLIIKRPADFMPPSFDLRGSQALQGPMSDYVTGAIKGAGGEFGNAKAIFDQYTLYNKTIQANRDRYKSAVHGWDAALKWYTEENKNLRNTIFNPFESPFTKAHSLMKFKAAREALDKAKNEYAIASRLDFQFKPFGEFLSDDALKKFTPEMQEALKKIRPLINKETLPGQFDQLLKNSFKYQILDSAGLQRHLTEEAQKIVDLAQKLFREGRSAEARDLIIRLNTDIETGKVDWSAVYAQMDEINDSIVRFEDEYRDLIDRIKNGDTLSEVLLDFTGSPEQREVFIQYVKEITEDAKQISKYLNDTRNLTQQFSDPARKLEAQRREFERLSQLNMTFDGKTKTGQEWLDAIKDTLDQHPLLEGEELLKQVLKDAGIDQPTKEVLVLFKGQVDKMANLKKELEDKVKIIQVPVQIKMMDAIRSETSSSTALIRRHVHAPTFKVNQGILTQVRSINRSTQKIMQQGQNSTAPTIIAI